MGLLSIIKKQKIKDKEIRVLMLGLDNSGKTTITKKLLNQDVSKVSPTLGFQINTINHHEFNLNIWDIGGQTSLRTFWGNYFDQTNVVIWVIDSLSLERLNESYRELKEKVILQDRLTGVYLVVLINKMDLVEPGLHQQIRHLVAQTLDLPLQIPQKDKWTIELVSGFSGTGLSNVLNWIITREY